MPLRAGWKKRKSNPLDSDKENGYILSSKNLFFEN